jgi:uncharacterized membrane protein YesL
MMLRTLISPLVVIKDGLVLWWDEWINWIVVNLLWLLCWLTIVLGPPATFGIHFVAASLVEGESLGVRGLLDGGKKYFAKSWLWMVVNTIVIVIIVFNILFYYQIESNWAQFIQGIILFVGFLWILVQLYTLPFFMLQEDKSLRVAWRNALFTIIASPFHALIIFAFILLLTAVSIMTVLPVFFGVPGLIVVLTSSAVKDRVKAFQEGIRDKTKDGDPLPGEEHGE